MKKVIALALTVSLFGLASCSDSPTGKRLSSLIPWLEEDPKTKDYNNVLNQMNEELAGQNLKLSSEEVDLLKSPQVGLTDQEVTSLNQISE